MERKAIDVQIKASGDEGVIEGYGSVFNIRDMGGDIVEAGAFADTLENTRPKMLWQHDMAAPIGRWDEYREDESGLYMRGTIATKSTQGRDAYELVKAGAIEGLSIGYIVRDYDMDGDTRRLKRVDLIETSLVTMPMNPAAMVTGVKNADVRDIEAAFRQLGFSRSEAKAMAGAAWKRRNDVLRDAGVDVPEIDQREVDELKAKILETLNSIGGHCV